jgi:VWFA-related protein
MMTGSTRILVLAVTAATLFSAGGPPLSAQQRTDQTPSFRSGIEVVTVDVGVVDRQGQPLRGLTPADFVVTVGGQPRHVVTAEFIDRTGTRAAGSPQTPGTLISTNEGGGVGRLFAFIVDQNTLEIGSARRVATATAPFFSRLTFADRSALMLMPLGPNLPFTWAHDRVRAGLQRATGMGRMPAAWEYGSLADARDIANHNLIALRSLGERQCGTSSASIFGAGPTGQSPGIASPPVGPTAPSGGGTSPSPSGGGETGGTGAPTAPPAGGTSAPAGGSSGSSRGGSNLSGSFGLSNCTREIQMQAETTWRTAQMNSLASISALRQFLSLLARVRGDKTIILISGGWPLDERDELSTISAVASDAAAARATIFSVFVPTSSFTADRRVMTSTPLADNYLHSAPLETLAAMTGGGSFRAEVGAEAVFERLAAEMAGYYRIGIEKDPSDNDGKIRRMKVQVPRGSATIRAREIFDVRTYEDRDWAARLATALEGPVPATDLGLRVTHYLSADPDDSSRRRLLVSGEASRVQPGDVTLQVRVSDLDGKKIGAGELSLAHARGDTLPFSTNVSVPPGSYIIRLGLMDSGGRVGSVDHRVDVRDVPLGALSAIGPVLIRVTGGAEGDARLALDGARQDERLAIEIDLEGEKSRLEGLGVDFEIAATGEGPRLVHATAAISPGSRENTVIAQGVADMRVLPPGEYVVRAKVTSGTETVGDVRRAFSVLAGATRVVAVKPASSDEGRTEAGAARSAVRPIVAAPPFALDQVLAPSILSSFLDRVAARPDASSPAVRELLSRARTTGLHGLIVSDAQAASGPVPAFLKGLTLLSDSKLEPAADAFRDAMGKSLDFYPAMVYLGACYAAGGKDKEAASVWRTALIREGDTPALHVMLADSLLRQGRAGDALDDLDEARSRWPDDLGLKRRFTIAALVGGKPADGLRALDELLEKRGEDEHALAFGLLALYEAFESGQPIESADRDRARMTRLADAYRVRGGPSLALIDTWLAAANKK